MSPRTIMGSIGFCWYATVQGALRTSADDRFPRRMRVAAVFVARDCARVPPDLGTAPGRTLSRYGLLALGAPPDAARRR